MNLISPLKESGRWSLSGEDDYRQTGKGAGCVCVCVQVGGGGS